MTERAPERESLACCTCSGQAYVLTKPGVVCQRVRRQVLVHLGECEREHVEGLEMTQFADEEKFARILVQETRHEFLGSHTAEDDSLLDSRASGAVSARMGIDCLAVLRTPAFFSV